MKEKTDFKATPLTGFSNGKNLKIGLFCLYYLKNAFLNVLFFSWLRDDLLLILSILMNIIILFRLIFSNKIHL